MFFDAGGAVARRRRDVSSYLSRSCLSTAIRSPFVIFCNFPDYHRYSSLILFLVVGDPFKTFNRVSSLRQSFTPARLFSTFHRLTWMPVRIFSRFSLTTDPARTSPLSHLPVKTNVKLPRDRQPPSRSVPPSHRSTQPLIAADPSPRRRRLLIIIANEKLGFLGWGLFGAFGNMGLVNIKPSPSDLLTQANTWLRTFILKHHSPSRVFLSRLCSTKDFRGRDSQSGEASKELQDAVVSFQSLPNSFPTINSGRFIMSKVYTSTTDFSTLSAAIKLILMVSSSHLSYCRSFLWIYVGSISVFFFMDKQFSKTSSYMERSLLHSSSFMEKSIPQTSSVSERMIPPVSSSLDGIIKSSNALFARATYDHKLVLEFLKLVFIYESIQAHRDILVIASFLELSISMEKSSSLYLYLSCNVSVSICMVSPPLRI